MKSKLPIVNTILLIAILSYTLIGNTEMGVKDEQVYVVTVKLFEEFDYQQELNSDFLSIKEKKQKELQSEKEVLLKLEEIISEKKASNEQIKEYEYRFNRYLELENSVNEELSSLSDAYNVQIWNKLNAFIEEFGKQYEYDIIFGAVGNGSVMYAKEEKNITQELIAFCNAKYNGK